jgi:hypothetical protein
MPHHKKKYASSSSSSSSSSRSSYSSSSSDSSYASDVEELEYKLTKKIEKLYCKFLWNLRREPCLMLNGSDAHASVYSYTPHSFAPGDNIIYDAEQYATNIDYTNETDFLIVRRTGLYYFTWAATFNEPCQLAIFINGVVNLSTVISNNSGATVTAASQMLRLVSGDRLELRNTGLNTITTATPAVGAAGYQSQNVDLTIFKIAPNIEVCGHFPVPFEHGKCCDDVEKWNLADKNNDSVVSKCEEKVYKVEKKCETPCVPPPPVHCPPAPPAPCEPEKHCHKKHRKHHRH